MPRAPTVSLVWFRFDLRLADNPALEAARQRGRGVVPVFIWTPEEEGGWPPGAASRWWLHCSLASLDAGLRRRGARIVLRRGPTLPALRELARTAGAGAVFWNRRYEPAARDRDSRVQAGLQADGLTVETFPSALLFEPGELSNAAGRPYRVFSAFWQACLAQAEPAPPRPAPRSIAAPARWPKSLPLAALRLESQSDWTRRLDAAWEPGESGAQRRLRRFLRETVAGYPVTRDRPGIAGTSQLSPHLRFGEISPSQVWQAVHAAKPGRSGWAYLRQLGWREFAHHLLWHFPHTVGEPLRAEFARFPWRTDQRLLSAWQRGRTGYPIVDAGLRQLGATGWVHNRVRMIVASFLVKDLLVPWQDGAKWFWDTLVDADLANNTLGWQWTAGCGADAAPYFRVFNPVIQGAKFDPDGRYIRRWVPELKKVPDRFIHTPWKAPSAARPGYPLPIVDHARARRLALTAYERIKKA